MAIFESKTPIIFHLLKYSLVISPLLFAGLILFQRLDIISSVLVFFVINTLLYCLFGRYVCRLTLFNDRLIVHYLYPVSYKKEYLFTTIEEVDARDDSIYNLYRGFYRLYISTSEGTIYDVKYNINGSDNEKFLYQMHKLMKQSGLIFGSCKGFFKTDKNFNDPLF